jgi:hypothetical protein
VLGKECRGLLVGERALPSVVAEYREVAQGHPAVDAVVELKTMHIGPDAVLVTLRLRFRAGCDAVEAAGRSAARFARRTVMCSACASTPNRSRRE